MTTIKADVPARVITRKSTSATSDRVVGGISHTILTIWSLIVVLPLLWTVMSSFKTSSEIFSSPFSLPSKWNFDNYVGAWTTAGIGSFLLNSIIVVFGALAVTMLFGAMCAYVLARFQFPGNRAIYYLMLAGLTFPIFLAIVPLFFVLRSIGLLNTLPGLILTYAAFALPFTVFFLFSFFKALPLSIAEAAALDGAGEWRTFFQVMLPMSRPGLATVAILNFVGLWNQFLLPVALNTDPKNYVLTQGMASFASQAGYSVNFGQLFARGHPQLRRTVEPVPAAGGPEYRPEELRAHPGHGVVRVSGGVLGQLRPALRRSRHDDRAGVHRLPGLSAPAAGFGVAGHEQVASCLRLPAPPLRPPAPPLRPRATLVPESSGARVTHGRARTSQRWCTGSWARYTAKLATVNLAPSLRRPGRCHESPGTASKASASAEPASTISVATVAGSCSL